MVGTVSGQLVVLQYAPGFGAFKGQGGSYVQILAKEGIREGLQQIAQ